MKFQDTVKDNPVKGWGNAAKLYWHLPSGEKTSTVLRAVPARSPPAMNAT